MYVRRSGKIIHRNLAVKETDRIKKQLSTDKHENEYLKERTNYIDSTLQYSNNLMQSRSVLKSE